MELGHGGARRAIASLLPLATSRDAALALDATGAIARIAARGPAGAAVATLCPLLADARPLVRANALAGLALSRVRCADGARERALLTDASDEVRAAAAHAIGATSGSPEDEQALAACSATDRSGEVA